MCDPEYTIDEKSLPIALQWVARSLGEHPHIESISFFRRTDESDKVRAIARFITELPSKWKSESPSGVRRIENITIEFSLDYPKQAPKFYLRKDFNRSHPHLWATPKDSLPQPCLVNANSREFIQANGGITRLADQLVLWLERASEANLMDSSQTWEPTRRDRMTSVLVADKQKFEQLITPRGGCKCFKSTVQWPITNDDGMYWCFANSMEEKQIPNRKIDHIVNLSSSDTLFNASTLTFFCWPGQEIDGSPRIDSHYTPEFVDSMESMFQRARHFGCHTDLKIRVRKLRRLLSRFQLHTPIPFIFILVTRRPRILEGTNSCYEFCPYLVLAKSASDLSEDSTTNVIPLGHRNTVNPKLLKQTSMLNVAQPTREWIGVGCGSVGSKLAMHLTRAGKGPSAVVDYDYLEPHNYARHSALPFNSTTGQLLYRQKSTQLAMDLSTLGRHVKDHHADVVTVLGKKENNPIFGDCVDHVIVNSTGSLVVREALATTNWKEIGALNPLVVECCLMGAGKMGYFAVEGTDSNPNLADLSTTFYQNLMFESKLSEFVFQTEPEQINIGQGCGTQSFVISDSRISQHTASFAQLLDQLLLSTTGSEGGEIRYQILAEDGISITSKRLMIDPFVIVTNEDSALPDTRISTSVVSKIDSIISASPGVETGGLLVGRFSAIGNSFHVVDLIDAPEDSVFTRDLFVLGKIGLSERIEELASISNGSLYVLGTWHNHLIPSGPSNIDEDSALKMARTQQIPFLMLIRTPQTFITLSPPPFSNKCSE